MNAWRAWRGMNHGDPSEEWVHREPGEDRSMKSLKKRNDPYKKEIVWRGMNPLRAQRGMIPWRAWRGIIPYRA
jgi:hypothetical protein